MLHGLWGFPVAQLPAMWETWVWFLGWEDPREKGKATHSSTLAWRIPMDRGVWQATVLGTQRVGHDWVTKHSTALYQKFCTNSLKSGNHGEDRAELSCQRCYEVSVKVIIGKQLWAPWECSYLQYSSCRDLSSTQTEVAGQPWNLKHSCTNRSDHSLHGPTGCPFIDIRTMQMCSTLHLLHSGQWRNKKREKKINLKLVVVEY